MTQSASTHPHVLLALQGHENADLERLERAKVLAGYLKERGWDVSFWLDASPKSALRSELNQLGFNVLQHQWSLLESIRMGSYTQLVFDYTGPISPTMVQSIRLNMPTLPIIALDNTSDVVAELDHLVLTGVHQSPDSITGLRPTMAFQTGLPWVWTPSKAHALPPQVLHVPKETKRHTVLLTAGRSDRWQTCPSVLAALVDSRDCHFHVKAPTDFCDHEPIEKAASEMTYSTVTIHWSMTDAELQAVMAEQPICIVPFGLLPYQMMAYQSPMIVVPTPQADATAYAQFCEAMGLPKIDLSQDHSGGIDPASMMAALESAIASPDNYMLNPDISINSRQALAHMADLLMGVKAAPTLVAQDSQR